MRLAFLLSLIAAVAGCVQFPEVEDATGRAAEEADYPDLIPFDPLLDAIDTSEADTAQTQAQLEARASGLQARAATLRGTVLSGEDRRRLEDEVQ